MRMIESVSEKLTRSPLIGSDQDHLPIVSGRPDFIQLGDMVFELAGQGRKLCKTRSAAASSYPLGR